jgi:hypothetical protein
MSSAPASMEASKACDAFGLLPGHATQQCDAEQAYIQSKLEGAPTWVRMPHVGAYAPRTVAKGMGRLPRPGLPPDPGPIWAPGRRGVLGKALRAAPPECGLCAHPGLAFVLLAQGPLPLPDSLCRRLQAVRPCRQLGQRVGDGPQTCADRGPTAVEQVPRL